MATIKIVNGQTEASFDGIATNSLAVSNGDLLALASGFVAKATASTGRLIGCANGTKTYASDNQTVAKDVVNFLKFVPGETIIELTTTASIAAADVGKFFNLTGSQTVDHSTGRTFQTSVNTSDAGAAADAATIYPLQLVEYISATKGRFMVV